MKKFTSILVVLAMLLALAPMNVLAADSSAFSDVNDTDYYAQAATELAQQGILAGYPDGTFGADKSITRAEMAAIVCRMIDKESDAEDAKGKTAFDDVTDSYWASGYINVASEEGIISGDGNGKFRPGDDVKYEEALKMIVCALGYGDDIIPDPTDWSKKYLEVADEKGISAGLKGSKGVASTRGDVAVMSYNGMATVTGDAPSDTPADVPVDIPTDTSLSAPTASLPAGTHAGKKLVALETVESGADIYYTTDGSTPTIKSTKYTKAFTITKTCTLKAIAVKDGAASNVMSIDYTILSTNTGSGSSGSSASSAYTVSFDLNYAGATGAPASQYINDGGKAVLPTEPSRTGYTFAGWATTPAGETMWNFAHFVTSSMTLYAVWAADGDMSLDTPDPDVEIYSFNTDVFDVLVGTDEDITFTSEIFANIELSDTDVYVSNEEGTVVGYMNDEGINGDDVADDGIWTLKKNFVADAVGNELYHVVAKNVTSSTINIGYYREYTTEDFDAASDVATKLRDASQPYLNDDYSVDVEKVEELMSALALCLDEEKDNGTVADYSINFNTVKVVLVDGYIFNYSVEVAGVSAGGSQVYVASYAPFDSIRRNPEEEALYDSALDGTAENINNTFDEYTFSGNYNLNDVTLDSLKDMSNYKVIIWGGHGGYDNSAGGYGSSLMTGHLVDTDTSRLYSEDISSERILDNFSASGRNTYCVTGGFFDKYLGNMDGALVYLSACHSGQDMIDGIRHKYRLAQSFINKGAEAVVGNSESIISVYTYEMERDILNRMCESQDGEYYTLAEALSYAKSLNGQTDGSYRRAAPVIFPENNQAAQNYRFGEVATGSISGKVMSADNSADISDALVRIYKDNTLVTSVRTDANGNYQANLPAGDYVVKITAGNYKSAKMAVTVVEDTVTYNETFLLVQVGDEMGYANGTITNALNAQAVSGVTVKIRSSWNNQTGSIVYSTVSNEVGYYEVEYTPGLYTMEFSKDGYITGYKNIVVGVLGLLAQDAVISPVMSDVTGEYRFVLSWRNRPSDLDSHLTGPLEDSEERFHLYYPLKDTNGEGANPYREYATLDWDNTQITSNSDPETITVHRQIDGVYRYSVHDFTNSGIESSTDMANSNAKVDVYKGSILVGTYHVPNIAGTIWTVFELSGDEFTPVNRVGNGFAHDTHLFSLESNLEAEDAIYDIDVIVSDIVEK